MSRRDRDKAYYQSNKDRILEQCKEYRESNKERISERRKAYRDINKEKIAASDKEYRDANKEKIRQRKKAYREANSEHVKRKKKEWQEANREKSRLRLRAYYKANREKARAAWKRWREENRDRYNAYFLDKKAVDASFLIATRMRNRIRMALKSRSVSGTSRSVDLIGCTYEQLRTHIESLFLPGMSWERFGEIHIDHIVPCASFDLSDPEQQKICFHYTNLQPLWAKDNLVKGKRRTA